MRNPGNSMAVDELRAEGEPGTRNQTDDFGINFYWMS